jgi:hypothetical protein
MLVISGRPENYYGGRLSTYEQATIGKLLGEQDWLSDRAAVHANPSPEFSSLRSAAVGKKLDAINVACRVAGQERNG